MIGKSYLAGLVLVAAVSVVKAQPDSLWARTFCGASNNAAYSVLQTELHTGLGIVISYKMEGS